MNVEVISILFLVGAVQAVLILIGINLNKPFDTQIKKVASLLLFTMALMMTYYIVLLTGNELISPYIDSLGTAAWMALFPLYYLLCLSLTRPKFKLKRSHWLFFMVSVVFVVEEILTTAGLNWYVYFLVNDPQVFLDLWMAVFFGTGIYFAYKSLQQVSTSITRIRLKELKAFSYAFLGVLLFFGITYLVLRKNYTWTFELILISLLEVFIFVLLYRVFRFSSFKEVIGTATYQNGTASHSDFRETAIKLETAMHEHQPFLQHKLTLNQLAELSHINANRLSQLFSTHYRSSFYEFVNEYRLNHVEALLNDPETNRYTISAIAEMSGFNSKATFYKVFKEKHGVTPTEYINPQNN